MTYGRVALSVLIVAIAVQIAHLPQAWVGITVVVTGGLAWWKRWGYRFRA